MMAANLHGINKKSSVQKPDIQPTLQNDQKLRVTFRRQI